MMMGRQPLCLLDIDPAHALGELLWVVAELSVPHVLNEVRLELHLDRTSVTLVVHLIIAPKALNVVGAGASDRIDKVQVVIDCKVTVS